MCSAGVGRTGTLIAIDSEIERIKLRNAVNVFECVSKMRYHREHMVQTPVSIYKPFRMIVPLNSECVVFRNNMNLSMLLYWNMLLVEKPLFRVPLIV